MRSARSMTARRLTRPARASGDSSARLRTISSSFSRRGHSSSVARGGAAGSGMPIGMAARGVFGPPRTGGGAACQSSLVFCATAVSSLRRRTGGSGSAGGGAGAVAGGGAGHRRRGGTAAVPFDEHDVRLRDAGHPLGRFLGVQELVTAQLHHPLVHALLDARRVAALGAQPQQGIGVRRPTFVHQPQPTANHVTVHTCSRSSASVSLPISMTDFAANCKTIMAAPRLRVSGSPRTAANPGAVPRLF